MNASALVDRYLAIWNETDADRRRALIAEAWTEDCRYADPAFAADSHAGVDAMIGGFQAQFPGLMFVHTGEVGAHHDRIRFTWDLLDAAGGRLAAGTDVAVVAPDGRLADVTGFFDMAPALPDAAGQALEGVTA